MVKAPWSQDIVDLTLLGLGLIKINNVSTKGFVFYGVTFDLCRFCTFLNLAQPATL